MLALDARIYIICCLLDFPEADLHGLETVVLRYVLSHDDSLALRAFNSDHLAGLLMLHDVAAGALDLAVGTCVACNTLHLAAVTIVMLQDAILSERAVAKKALKE